MSPPRRVLFVAGTFGIGGAEQQLLNMVRVLLDQGHEPYVVSLEDGVFAERLNDLGVPVEVLPSGGPLKRLAQIGQQVRAVRPDVLQAAHNWVSAYVGIVGRMLRVPSVGALRSDPAETIAVTGRMGHLVLRTPKLIAVNSKVNLESAVALGTKRDRLVHLPNAVDTDRFSPDEQTPRALRSGAASILGIGRLEGRKRFDHFIDVVARLDAELGADAFRATLVGTGSQRDTLAADIQRRGLGGRLQMVESSDPRALYRDADLLLFTSDPGEGMPNVVLEAMATGVPVVGFESGDVADVLLDGRTGFLIDEHGDTAALAAAVRTLIEDRAQLAEFGHAARGHMMENYSFEALGRNLEELHQRVCG